MAGGKKNSLRRAHPDQPSCARDPKELAQRLRQLEAEQHDRAAGRPVRRSPAVEARIERDRLIRDSFTRAFSPIENAR